MTMSMIEYNTLNYIMYKEAMAKMEAQENEAKAARDDEVKKQLKYGSGAEKLSVLDENGNVPQQQSPIPAITGMSESDLQQVLEEEGLI